MWCRGWPSLGGCRSGGRREGISLAIGRRGRFGLVGFAPPPLDIGIVTTTLAVRDTAIGEKREARREGTGEHGG